MLEPVPRESSCSGDRLLDFLVGLGGHLGATETEEEVVEPLQLCPGDVFAARHAAHRTRLPLHSAESELRELEDEVEESEERDRREQILHG
jgi:hypothetical protein